MHRLVVLFVVLVILVSERSNSMAAPTTEWKDAGVVCTSSSPYARLHDVPIRAVTILDGFWKPRMEANRAKGIPELYRQLDEHGVLDNLRRLTGRKKVERKGPFWTDSDLVKWMEGAAFVLQSGDDPAIRKLLDGAIDDLVAIQRPDGYLNSFFVEDIADQRFRNLGAEHELYCAGHLFQSAIAHYRATGERKYLDAAVRYADFLTTAFGPGKIEQADGHPEVEMALVELYRTTGEKKYLDLAGYFLKIQNYAKRDAIEGHAVRAGYLASGAADYYAETGDKATMDALERVWQDMVFRKMYITGGVGARGAGEAFGVPYELPNEHSYAETCAQIASVLFNWRMLLIKGEARFGDVMERTLYNGFLSGVSLDGFNYFYVNPHACHKDYQRVPWFGCTCCPTNVVRMIASIPGYMFSTSTEGLWVHLYDSCRLDWRLEDGLKIRLEQNTRYPWEGAVEMTVSPDSAERFAIFLRIPDWCREPKVDVNGQPAGRARPGTYMRIDRIWQAGDRITLELPMPVELMEADPRVLEDRGSTAIQRGPVVYCLESTDNPGVPIRDVELSAGEELAAEFRPELLGGVTIVKAKGAYPAAGQERGPLYRPLGSMNTVMEEADLTAIPYYAWANRGNSHMQVWIPLGE